MITRYRQRFPSAMNGMEETLEACLQVLRLPEAHHKRLRTSNLLERTFGELKTSDESHSSLLYRAGRDKTLVRSPVGHSE